MTPGDAEAARSLLPRRLRAWLEAEQSRVTREVDERLLVRGTVDFVPPPFLPESRRVFRLVSRWVPADAVRVTDSGLARPLSRELVGCDRVLFLAHPLLTELAPRWLTRAQPGPEVFAAATASTRTVLAWGLPGAPPFFAKLSFPGELSGASRLVTAAEAVSSVGLSRLLSELPGRGPRLGLLREVLSVVPRSEGERGGFIVREAPRAALVPWFALTHPSRGGGPPLLLPMVRGARTSLTGFVGRQLLRPFLRAWLGSALGQGWMPEAHAQNLLVELDGQGRLAGRFFARDVEGIYADLGHLERASPRLSRMVRALPCVRNVTDDYDQLELGAGARSSLHAYFLGGPLWHLERAARSWVRRGLLDGPAPPRGAFRRLFFTELERAMREASSGPSLPRVTAPEAFAEWLFDERARRAPGPRPPRRVRRWLSLEQGVNEAARDPGQFAPVELSPLPARFRPGERPVFRLEHLELPERELALRRWRVPATLRRALFFERGGERLVRCFFHPWMRERHGLDAAERGFARGPLWATPTASPRSLVVWSEEDPSLVFGLKLSLDLELLRLNRLVREGKLLRAVVLTEVFDAIPATARRRLGFEVMREPLSMRQRELEHGTIVRELPPDLDRLVPGFSLFAERPGGRPPIALAEGGSRAEEVARWVEAHVFAPLVRVAAYLMFREGLLGDLHQQNVLFERAPGRGLSGRLVLRDLDSFKTDLALRRLRGKTLAPYRRHPASAEDLKLDGSEAHYDEAFGRELRAEWVYLAARLLRRWERRLGGREAVRRALAGRRLFASVDRMMLVEAAAHLGDGVVLDELRLALRARRSRRAEQALLALASARTAREALSGLDGSLLVDPEWPRRPLYSLNAMVHAWTRAESGELTSGRGPRAARR